MKCHLKSVYKHMKDASTDLNYRSTDVNIFSETRFSCSDAINEYVINGYELFRNDAVASGNVRPYGGTAVYSRLDFYPDYPYILNTNGIEITVLRFIIFPQITIIAIYCPPRISVTQLCHTLRDILSSLPTVHNIFIGQKLQLPLSNFIKYKTMDTPKTVFILIQHFD